MEVIRQVQRVSWDHATSNVGDLSDPLMVSFGTLPARELFAQQLAAAQRSPNRLAEGGCENLPAMLAAGWKHYQHPQAGIRTSVDLSPTSAHTRVRRGCCCRRRRPSRESYPAWSRHRRSGSPARRWTSRPATWCRSTPGCGSIRPIAASTDGLVIFDSQSGEPLAMRISQTKGWRQLTLYRAATQRGPLTLTFALAGLGQAAIDDVTIQIVHRTQPGWQQAQR